MQNTIMENNQLAQDKCNTCLFKKMICLYISEEEFAPLYNSSMQIKYKKGESIIKQGVKSNHIAFLSKGKVKVNVENEFGKNVILTIVKSPTLLGGATIFNESYNMASVIAIEDCEVCLIDINTLKQIITNNGLLVFKLLELISTMFHNFIKNFISMAQKQVYGRVADILLYLSSAIYESEQFSITLSRKELAEFAGCSQENIIHTLSKLNNDKIIEVNGKQITIVNKKKLNEISKLG